MALLLALTATAAAGVAVAATSGADSGFAASVKGRDPPTVIAAGRRWLDNNDPTGPARTAVYQRMLEAAGELSNLRQGNAIARDLLKDDQRRYGVASLSRLAGLYLAADWYGGAGRNVDERRLLAESITLIEVAAGPADPRLAYPLRRLAEADIRGQREAGPARAALDRALDLIVGSNRDDVLERAQAFVTRGDWEVVFGEPAAAAAWYRAGWRKLADSSHFGADGANATFREPVPLVVTVPAKPFASLRREPDFYAPGTVAYGFTVTAEGAVTDLTLRRNTAPTDALPLPLERALRRARYRPAIVDNSPRATPGHGYEFRFSSDASQPARSIRGGPIDQRF
jgi:hypothetical protein